MEFTFSADYKAHVQEYLITIKNVNDMLASKNSKFLFYSFNDYLNRKGLLVQYAKHT